MTADGGGAAIATTDVSSGGLAAAAAAACVFRVVVARVLTRRRGVVVVEAEASEGALVVSSSLASVDSIIKFLSYSIAIYLCWLRVVVRTWENFKSDNPNADSGSSIQVSSASAPIGSANIQIRSMSS